jgi:hypothetical protein
VTSCLKQGNGPSVLIKVGEFRNQPRSCVMGNNVPCGEHCCRKLWTILKGMFSELKLLLYPTDEVVHINPLKHSGNYMHHSL